MKIRKGFVSNSSSSSFIVSFPHKPQSEEDVHDMMFPNGEQNVKPYGESYNSKQIAGVVWKDIQDQGDNWILLALCKLEFDGAWFDEENGFIHYTPEWINEKEMILRGYPESHEYGYSNIEELKRDIEENEKHKPCESNNWEDDSDWRLEQVGYELKELEKMTGFVYVFEYSDECGGMYTVMEHGNIFENLPHQIHSHH